MISIIIQKNKSENNKIGKSLENISTIQGTLKESTSLISPIILIQSSTIPNGNYCTISSFNRKYFITDIVNVRNNLWELHLKCDVLETYINEIKSNSGIIKRQEVNYNKYLIDEKIPSLNDNEVYIRRIGTISFEPSTYKVVCMNAQTN